MRRPRKGRAWRARGHVLGLVGRRSASVQPERSGSVRKPTPCIKGSSTRPVCIVWQLHWLVSAGPPPLTVSSPYALAGLPLTLVSVVVFPALALRSGSPLQAQGLLGNVTSKYTAVSKQVMSKLPRRVSII